VFRGRDSTHFMAQEVELFGELIPHVKQAVALSGRLARVDFANAVALEALDALSMGLLILDEDGRAMHVNVAGASRFGAGEVKRPGAPIAVVSSAPTRSPPPYNCTVSSSATPTSIPGGDSAKVPSCTSDVRMAPSGWRLWWTMGGPAGSMIR
jgi:hypothetical protein